MQPVASTHPSSACLRHNLRDGATCTTRRRASASLQARLRNPIQTCFHAKQAARSRRVSHADLPPSVLWRNRQTEVCLVLRPNQETIAVILMPKSPNQSCWFRDPNPKTLHHLGFEAQPRNPPPVLKPNREKPSPLVLRPNQQKPSPPVLRPNRRKPSEWF
jgi:hypothetical protein